MELSTAVPYAQGATGRVLKAIDEASGRAVAIKVLRLDDPLWRARWQREAAALQRLDHPHVCALLVATDYEGQPALIFPFIDGASIDVALADASWRTTLTTMIDVVDALAHAHALGVVHRDLKPTNILVQQLDGRAHAWVVDFGLAAVSASDALTLEGQVLGTPGYLSPEQAQGRAATVRSDIYSLGALLFRLLAGRLPHAAERSTELLLRTIRDDAPLLSRFRPDLPPALTRLFDAETGGTQAGNQLTVSPVAVSSGIFTVQLDFGDTPFNSNPRWLEIDVRAAGGGSSTNLNEYTWPVIAHLLVVSE